MWFCTELLTLTDQLQENGDILQFELNAFVFQSLYACTDCLFHGPLAIYVKLRVAHAPGIPGTFSPTLRVNDPEMHHGTCMAHVPRCMPGSLTSGFRWSRRRGKRSLHSRRMRNQRFYVSGKRPTYASPNIVYFVVVVLSVAVDSHDTLSILFRIHTSFSKVWIKIAKFGYRKITLKMDAEWRPFCFDPDVLNNCFFQISSSLFIFSHPPSYI